ncbi:hypothetical protein IFM89_027278 [Coptis chinensis]|uniref:ABC transporter domain-containing protein n=1 Tax=Coptis chinensis TaxID=261450 RepID=A0A835LJM5_9MAGN|nr:hypothetical protein IFM89_027278 [Coptis chinensis]
MVELLDGWKNYGVFRDLVFQEKSCWMVRILRVFEWLRSQIGLVTHEPALLSLSIRDNIAYGRCAMPNQIEEAAKTMHAHTFINSFEKGNETQSGLALTEEQKIKLYIARKAVLSNTFILLLDEVLVALTLKRSEPLDILRLGRSTIIIARRLSLIRNADYIAVMEEGQLVEMGTHEELFAIDSLYAELLKCEEAAKLSKRYNQCLFYIQHFTA